LIGHVAALSYLRASDSYQTIRVFRVIRGCEIRDSSVSVSYLRASVD
jgi:hypothetical protein